MPSLELFLTLATVLATLTVRTAAQSQPSFCPLLGQQWPAPKNLSGEKLFQALQKNMTTTLQQMQNTEYFNETSYSLAIFSGTEDEALFQYDQTAPSVRHSQNGVHNITANTIFRIGSVSKMMTIYMLLAEVGPAIFDDPITKYIPELVRAANTSYGEDFIHPKWQHITVGDLSAQLGGLADDIGSDLITEQYGAQQRASTENGWPDIPLDGFTPCNMNLDPVGFQSCTEEEYIRDLAGRYQPVFPNAYTPVYSNDGFELVGIALSRAAKNKTLSEIFDNQLVKRLGLQGASFGTTNSTCDAAIPYNVSISGWGDDLGRVGPTGGNFASTNDMIKVGRSILQSSLLSQSITRRWLKPASFLENFAQGVGRPWEIYRAKIDNYSVDVYSKGGDYKAYHSFFAVIPQYDVGISILTAVPEDQNGVVRYAAPSMIIPQVLETINNIAEQQAKRNFAGYYVAENFNSSLLLTADDLQGLNVSSWISNSTNMLQTPLISSAGVGMRLVPNLLYTGNKVGFTGVPFPKEDPSRGENGDPSVMLRPCQSWLAVGRLQYGGVDVGQFVFETNSAGKAVSVYSKALRVKMTRQL